MISRPSPLAPLMILICSIIGLMVGSSLPAHAGEDRLELSLDGRSWTTSIDEPLFDRSRIWVPGDHRSVDVQVRNSSPGDARLTIQLLEPGNTAFATNELAVSVSTAQASTTLLIDSAPASTVVVPHMSGEQVLALTITVDFSATAGNDTQRQAIPLDLVLRLTQLSENPSAEDESPEGSSPEHGGDLADTGAPRVTTAGVLGVLAIAITASILSRRRTASQTALREKIHD